nr:transposase [Nocardia cerradoensis]
MREETLRAANLAIIDYHQRLPLTTVFGAGTLSSSDGQRFPVRGKSTSARGDGHPRRAGAVDLHPCHRSARHLRHEDHRRHETRSTLRP